MMISWHAFLVRRYQGDFSGEERADYLKAGSYARGKELLE